MATIPNIAKGKIAYYASLPAANDALVWVLLQSTGIETEAALRDYTTLSALLAGASDEVTSTGYARVTATSVTATVDQTNDWVTVDAADPSWTVTASVQNVGGVVLCYDDDTTGGTDANLVPIFVDVLGSAFTPTASVAFSYIVAASGFGKAA